MQEDQYTILFVDDEKRILNSLFRLLRKEPYRMLMASSGQEALGILEKEQVHMVVSDQRMPQMNGTELLTQVRQRHPLVVRIILTGYSDVGSITDSINKGHIFKFIHKPWNDQMLKIEIHQALDYVRLLHSEISPHAPASGKKTGRPTGGAPSNSPALWALAALNSLSLPMMVGDGDGGLVFHNRAAETFFNNQGVLCTGNSLSRCLPEEAARAVRTSLKEKVPVQAPLPRPADSDLVVETVPLEGPSIGHGVLVMFKPCGPK